MPAHRQGKAAGRPTPIRGQATAPAGSPCVTATRKRTICLTYCTGPRASCDPGAAVVAAVAARDDRGGAAQAPILRHRTSHRHRSPRVNFGFAPRGACSRLAPGAEATGLPAWGRTRRHGGRSPPCRGVGGADHDKMTDILLGFLLARGAAPGWWGRCGRLTPAAAVPGRPQAPPANPPCAAATGPRCAAP